MIKSIFSIKQILIVSLSFIISLAMVQTVYASTNAFDDGYQAARSDFWTDTKKIRTVTLIILTPILILYAWYKLGYEAGWAADKVCMAIND